MTVEHHDLLHEFPEHRERIHEMKMNNHHFRKLFDEYHELTSSIESMENESVPVSTEAEETSKLRRLRLKDEMYKMLAG